MLFMTRLIQCLILVLLFSCNQTSQDGEEVKSHKEIQIRSSSNLNENDYKRLIANDDSSNECVSSNIQQLKQKAFQQQFMKQVDSISSGDKVSGIDTRIWQHIPRNVFNSFVEDLEVSEFMVKKYYEKRFDFNLAPNEFIDSPDCFDEIILEYNPASCLYSLKVLSSFYVQDLGCSEHSVIYYFELDNAVIRIVNTEHAG